MAHMQKRNGGNCRTTSSMVWSPEAPPTSFIGGLELVVNVQCANRGVRGGRNSRVVKNRNCS